MTPEKIALLIADERAWDELYSPFDLKVRTLVTRLAEERQGTNDVYADYQDAVKRLHEAEQRIAELERERNEFRDMAARNGVIGAAKLDEAERQLAEFRTHLKWWVGAFGDVQVAEHEGLYQRGG